MKSTFAATLVAAAVGASAQSSSYYSAVSPSVSSTSSSASMTPSASMSTSIVMKYEYYNDCETETSGSSTMTRTIVQTYCPECTDMTSGVPGSNTGVMTTYTTIFSEFCSNSASSYMQEKTYTVTESCSSSGLPREASYVPQGFTVTTATCTVCEGKSIVATITTPVSTAATPGAPAPAPAVPTASGAGSPPAGSPPAGSPPAGSPPAGSAAGSAPAPAGPAPAPGASSPAPGASAPAAGAGAGAGTPVYPTPASEGRTGAAPTGSSPSGGLAPGSSSVIPFAGSASTLSMSFAAGLVGFFMALASRL